MTVYCAVSAATCMPMKDTCIIQAKMDSLQHGWCSSSTSWYSLQTCLCWNNLRWYRSTFIQDSLSTMHRLPIRMRSHDSQGIKSIQLYMESEWNHSSQITLPGSIEVPVPAYSMIDDMNEIASLTITFGYVTVQGKIAVSFWDRCPAQLYGSNAHNYEQQ